MELRQLVYAVAVADARHFTRAAEALHTAQPAISHQVRKLERELGVDLFERGRSGATPTPAGEVVLSRARRVLSEIRALREEIDEIHGLASGQVEFGAVHNVGPLDLAEMIASFHRAHPGVEVRLREVSTETMYGLVADDRLDLALAALDVAVPDGLETKVLLREPLVCAVPSEHRLARRRRIRMSDLAEERFVAFPVGTGLRAATERAAADGGFALRVPFETSEMSRVLALVKRGVGVTLIPASTTLDAKDGITRVDISPVPERSIGAVWRRGRSLAPAARAFLALLLDSESPDAADGRRTAGEIPTARG